MEKFVSASLDDFLSSELFLAKHTCALSAETDLDTSAITSFGAMAYIAEARAGMFWSINARVIEMSPGFWVTAGTARD